MVRLKEFGLIVGVIFVDQISKILFFSKQELSINSGGVWGIFPSFWWIPLTLSLLIMVGLEAKRSAGWKRKALFIIFASGTSNLIDRILFGGVRDFIYWPILGVYGNIADVLLGLGVVILIWTVIKGKL